MLNYESADAIFTGGEPDMRALAIAAGFAVLCGITSPVLAADMAVKATKEARVVAEPMCLRWVQQNYSWYNYCDPIPYYPRATRYWWGL